ncbi:MAG: beta-lactamase family protein [Planctomycetes bacterium]|nr:beta-lactamase family protein [Planctomycetota bacterium]
MSCRCWVASTLVVGFVVEVARAAPPIVGRAVQEVRATPSLAPESRAALLADLEALRKRSGVPGVSVALLQGGEITLAEGLGVRRAGGDVAVDRDTLFQAGSISKPVAAVGALRLVAAGVLDLDSDVNDRLASFAIPDSALRHGKAITLRGLLSHTAGLSVHGFLGYLGDDAVPSLLDILEGAPPANSPPIVVELEPGTKWQYSGGGYTVMQQLVIDVTERDFAEFLRDEVLAPAGMTRSSYEQPLPIERRANVAAGHGFPPKPVRGDAPTMPELAAAGLWTTASDLLRFGRELQRSLRGGEGTLLPKALMEEALRPVLDGDYGLGFQLFRDSGLPLFGHSGANQGFRAMLVLRSDGEEGLALMANGDGGDALLGPARARLVEALGWQPAAEGARKSGG